MLKPIKKIVFCIYLSPRFFTFSKLERTPMKEGTPLSSTEDLVFSDLPKWNAPQWNKASPSPIPKPPFFLAFQTGKNLNDRRQLSSLYRNPHFFTPSKLVHTPMKEGTPPPSTKARVISRLPNWNITQWKKAPLLPLLKQPFFHPSTKVNTFQLKKALLPPVPKPLFFHIFQIEIH